MASNPEQLEAVQCTGHCVVLAGPGSGKTKTLTTAMVRALIEDVVDPRGVACITYNNECAIELESRLAKLGVEPSSRVFIGTVHSFALTQVISPYARCALPDWPATFRVATMAEQRWAVETAHTSLFGDSGDPHGRWRFATEKRKRDVNRSKPEWLGRNPELAQFIEAYEKLLRSRGLIDFDDMPLVALRLVQTHSWIRNALSARFPVLFVDEYQDLGYALHELVLSLCFDAGIRLFAVGDVDQSIYGFTGANPELLETLVERSNVRAIRLKFNYRSGQAIINASMAALGEDRNYQASENTPEGKIFFKAIEGENEAQARYIAKNLIPELVVRGIPLDEIAVLYRNAQQGNMLAEAALAEALPIVRADNRALVRRNSRLSRFAKSCARWCTGGWVSASPRFNRLVREAAVVVYGNNASETERQILAVELMSFLNNWIGKTSPVQDWLRDLRSCLITPWRSRARTPEEEWSGIDDMIHRTLPGEPESEITLEAFGGKVGGGGRLNLSTLHSAKVKRVRGCNIVRRQSRRNARLARREKARESPRAKASFLRRSNAPEERALSSL